MTSAVLPKASAAGMALHHSSAIKAGRKADPEVITKALWGVNVKGINGDIEFIKQGPAGKESAQSVPSVYLVKIDGGKVIRQ